MRVYFNGSVSSKQKYLEEYRKIVEVLEKLDCKVFAKHVLDYPASKRLQETAASRKKYYYEMVSRIKKSDLMVAEVSFPSTVHVGHELTLALDLGKPVLALHKKNKRPMLFWGLVEEKFLVEEYDLSNIEKILKNSIDYLTDQMDTRFNFFISPKIGNYLDWIAKKRKTPRAVYLRRLIEKEMDSNKEYSK